MSAAPTQITFFEFLTPLVASGLKTITIRDISESHYQPGSQVEVFTLENHISCRPRKLAISRVKAAYSEGLS